MLTRFVIRGFTKKSRKDYVPRIFKDPKFIDPELRVPKEKKIHPETQKLRTEVG